MTVARLLSARDVSFEVVASAERRYGFEDEYPFASRWFKADGQTLHYLDEGSGPPLLMVHGNPTWSFAWRHLVRNLRQKFRVIAIDHLGCGFSSKPQQADYSLNAHIGRLCGLVQTLDLNDVTLFAHDWGGAIGMGAAGRMPDRFSQFVLMNTAAFRSKRIPFRISLCRIPLLGTLGMQGLNLFSLAAIKMATSKGLSESARRGLLAPYKTWNERRAVREFVHDIPLSKNHPSYQTLAGVEAALAQFRDRRMLLFWGMQDWCFSPPFYDEFCDRFPSAIRYPVENAGHYVFEDAREELLAASSAFLAGQDPSSGR